jgi:hypothetical protein
MLRRFWPVILLVVGARMLFGSFLFSTAVRESFADRLSTPIGLILIVVGGYFLMKDWD